MSSPAPLSAPDSRLAPLPSPLVRAGAAALLLALSPAAARAGCTTREVGSAAEFCNGGTDRVACQARLQSLWFDCQESERQKGRPYPRITSDDAGVVHANLGGVVFALRNMHGLPTFPEAKARADGTERDVGYWGQERFRGENELYVRARGRQLSEADATAWLEEQLALRDRRRAGEPRSEADDSARDAPPRTGAPRRRPGTQDATDALRDETGARGLAVAPNAPLVPPTDMTRAQLLSGDHRGAAATAGRMLEADPDDVGALEMRARARMLAGDRDGAFADARRVLRLDPKNKEARAILGGADAVAGSSDRFGRMKVGLDALREDDGGPAGAGGGEQRGGGGRDGRAGLGGRDEFAAPAALLEGPGAAADPKAAQLRELWNGAQRYANLGDWGSALREASRLVSLNPEDPEAWLLRSKISSKMGNWEAAEADARKALALKPDDPAALLILGRALVQQGKVVDGLAVIERALALQPRNALAHYYRGEALEKLGRKGEALDEYNLALQLDPGLGPLVEEALARLNPGMAVPQGGRGAPAAPAKRWFRLAVAALGSLFLLKGLHFLVGGRLKTSFTAKPETTTRPPLREEDQQAGGLGRDPIAGDVLGGNFKVERELARGGMGVVYLATDIVLRRLVAIKRLHWEHMRTEETRRKFLQEAQLAARLKHPNLAQIHSVFGDRELYLVFELVEGQTLDALLAQKGRLSLTEVRAIVGQVCRALEHAHGHRVIHRDLKPANIMLSRDGSCKVMDFGIAHEARTASGATQTQAWGTPPYMAPEQEEGYVSPASDLYALAVVAYELLAGRRPFDGPSQHAAKRTAGFKRIGGQDGLPAELDRFFERALHPEAALRYTTAADFRAAFEELAGTPVGR